MHHHQVILPGQAVGSYVCQKKNKVLWWRVMNGFLPTRGTLHREQIEPTAHFEVCGADEESIKYALVECTVAKFF